MKTILIVALAIQLIFINNVYSTEKRSEPNNYFEAYFRQSPTNLIYNKISTHELSERLKLKNNYHNTSFHKLIQKNTKSLLPQRWDWRDVSGYSYVTPIRDQGKCGACWAFATAAALESHYLIQHTLPNFNLDLSEQYMLSCGSHIGDCVGGWTQKASEFIVNHGLPLESCFPYRQFEIECYHKCPDWQKQLYKIDNWILLSKNTVSPEFLKENLLKFGPLVVVMDIQSDFIKYNGGIYKYTDGYHIGGHSVLLVGYDDYEQYFIVKNSQGHLWGENGYFKIAYSEVNPPVDFGYITIAFHYNKVKLIIDRIGNGIITDNHNQINCGSICVAEYPAGTNIILNANGQNLSNWNYYACQDNNNVCTLTPYITTLIRPSFGKTKYLLKDSFSTDNSLLIYALDLTGEKILKAVIYDNQIIKPYWQPIDGRIKDFKVIDLNGNFIPDILAVNFQNEIYLLLDEQNTWKKIPGRLHKFDIGDIDGNGMIDICGLNLDGEIYCTLDLNSWIQIPGHLRSINLADLNNDGKKDIIGLNQIGDIYYSTNLRTFERINGNLIDLIPLNLDRNNNVDLAGINSKGEVFYSLNNGEWRKLNANLSEIMAFDLNKDGIDDLIGINQLGEVYYTTDLKTWKRIHGILATQILPVHLLHNPTAIVIAIDINGKMCYSKNLSTFYCE